MTKALVLSGGASKGAYQLGVLKKWMGEQDIDYEIMCGVSVGALNVAGLAMTPYGNPRESIAWLEKFWLDNVETKTIYRRWFPFGRLHALWQKSVYDSRPLMQLVRSNLDVDRVKNCGRKVAVGAVCLEDGSYGFGRETDPNFVEWVLASASFPVFLTPIEINGKLWSDGGIESITPLGAAIKLGATDIDVIMCNNVDVKSKWDSRSKIAVPDQASRSLDLMQSQIGINDLRVTGLKNELAVTNPKYKVVTVRIVEPSNNLVDNSLDFNKSLIRDMIEIGYRDADNVKIIT